MNKVDIEDAKQLQSRQHILSLLVMLVRIYSILYRTSLDQYALLWLFVLCCGMREIELN
jgi:hypothetical protein